MYALDGRTRTDLLDAQREGGIKQTQRRLHRLRLSKKHSTHPTAASSFRCMPDGGPSMVALLDALGFLVTAHFGQAR